MMRPRYVFVLVTVQSSTYLVVLPDPRPVTHTALHRGVCGGAVLQSKARRDETEAHRSAHRVLMCTESSLQV